MAQNPLVQTTIGQADPNANPIKINDLITLLNQLLHSEILGSYIPYVIQHEAPGVDDQDKAWIELDTAGRPIAMKVWYAGNPGAWRRIYNGMIGEIRGYSGNPNDDFDKNVTTGAWGAGKIGQQYDGWYLCNGLNGTPNLSDKFLIGAHMDNSATHQGYSNGWQTTITGPNGVANDYKTGGRFVESLISDNLPLLSNAKAGDDPGLWIYGAAYHADAAHEDAKALVDVDWGNLLPYQVNLTAGVPSGVYGKNPPTPVWTLPNFVALGWIIFKGY